MDTEIYNGMDHKLLVPGQFYTPSGNTRITSPQKWVQTGKEKNQKRTYCRTIALLWGKIIKYNKEVNLRKRELLQPSEQVSDIRATRSSIRMIN